MVRNLFTQNCVIDIICIKRKKVFCTEKHKRDSSTFPWMTLLIFNNSIYVIVSVDNPYSISGAEMATIFIANTGRCKLNNTDQSYTKLIVPNESNYDGFIIQKGLTTRENSNNYTDYSSWGSQGGGTNPLGNGIIANSILATFSPNSTYGGDNYPACIYQIQNVDFDEGYYEPDDGGGFGGGGGEPIGGGGGSVAPEPMPAPAPAPAPAPEPDMSAYWAEQARQQEAEWARQAAEQQAEWERQAAEQQAEWERQAAEQAAQAQAEAYAQQQAQLAQQQEEARAEAQRQAAEAAAQAQADAYAEQQRQAAEAAAQAQAEAQARAQAEAQAEAESIKSIREAGSNGSWQAHAWYLERKFKARWSKEETQNINHSGSIESSNEEITREAKEIAARLNV